MPIDAFAKQHCSVARPLAVLGERWTFLVLRELFLGFRRFDEIQGRLGSPATCSAPACRPWSTRASSSAVPTADRRDRFEYRLTEKGRDLQPVLLQLMRWSDEHMPVKGGPIHELTHTDCGHVFHPVQSCSHCGGEVHAGNVDPPLRPGRDGGTEADGGGCWLSASSDRRSTA